MLIKTPDKQKAFEAVINMWLKDKTMYCNNCGTPFIDHPFCCEDPQIGRNIDHCKGVINQNKELMKTRLNDFASNKDKTMRWGLSIPPGLHTLLDQYKKMHGLPGLFKEEGEIAWFMKKFPAFNTCKRV